MKRSREVEVAGEPVRVKPGLVKGFVKGSLKAFSGLPVRFHPV
jgi:hypothetical protein